MALGLSELLVLFFILLLWMVLILVIYNIIKRAVKEGVKEALERRIPSLQTTTRICPQCKRGVTEEANFCPYCGKELR